MTGTVAKFDYASGGLHTTVENFEPLGQQLYPTDPSDYEPPAGGFTFNNADYPEWMCEESNARSVWGEFHAWPWDCQRKYMNDEDRYGRYSRTVKLESPQNVGMLVHPAGYKATGSDIGLVYATRRFMQKTLTSSAKDNDGGSDPDCELDNAGYRCTVNAKAPEESIIDMSDTGWVSPQTQPNSRRRISEGEAKKIADDIQAILDTNPGCQDFINKILNEARSDANPVVSSKILDVFWAVYQQNGIYLVEDLDAGGKAWPSVARGTAEIEILARSSSIPGGSASGKRHYKRTQELLTARTGLAETIHLAGAYSYNDIQMSLATASISKLPLPDLPTDRPREGQSVSAWIRSWSNFWHPIVDKHCAIGNVMNAKGARRLK